MKMKIKIKGKKLTELELSSDTVLYDAINAAGETVISPCAGAGRCGKCKVYAKGALSPLSEAEIEHLTEAEIKNGVRLACHAYAVGDAEIEIPDLTAEINADTNDINIPENVTGLAVDIGTTTVAVKYIKNGCVMGTRVTLNPQVNYGADVISRIGHAALYGSEKLTESIKNTVKELSESLGADEGTPSVVVGNTVMLHFYEGLDASSIGAAPFLPKSYFGYEKDGEYLPRCISGYVGADAVSSVIASKMTETDTPSLLCDIGTNGELLYWDGEVLHTVSAAAGPCLEGAGIENGMIASDGAIDRVTVENGKLICHVIGDTAPCGICGGGLIDAVAALLEIGAIDESGYMESEFDISGVKIYPSDIRAFQLAKSAIRTGISMLLKNKKTPEKIYIAGGFGSGISVESAIRVGLFPESFSGRVEFIGNGALTGAVMMLSSLKYRKNAEMLAKNAVYTELSGSAEFSELFIDNLGF